jgi:hypothetical protein
MRTELLQWIATGEVGISSKTMCSAIVGAVTNDNITSRDFDIPHDPSDFSRCYRFYKHCNLTQEELAKVKDVFPYWEPIILKWDDLVNLYECKKFGELYDTLTDLRVKSNLIRNCKNVIIQKGKIKDKENKKK